jgi:hypothetical protein
MIEIVGADGRQKITGWADSSGRAIIIWRIDTGGTHQRELADEQEAIRFLESINQDPGLTLISAELRRPGSDARS